MPLRRTVLATASGKQVTFDVPAQLKAGATELTLVNNTKEAAELQLVQLDERHTLAEFYPVLESEAGAPVRPGCTPWAASARRRPARPAA